MLLSPLFLLAMIQISAMQIEHQLARAECSDWMSCRTFTFGSLCTVGAFKMLNNDPECNRDSFDGNYGTSNLEGRIEQKF